MIEVEIKAFLGDKATKSRDAKEAGNSESDKSATIKEDLIKKLRELGFGFDYACDESDCYYQAPDRDFRKTDEALRIRSVMAMPESSSPVPKKAPVEALLKAALW